MAMQFCHLCGKEGELRHNLVLCVNSRATLSNGKRLCKTFTCIECFDQHQWNFNQALRFGFLCTHCEHICPRCHWGSTGEVVREPERSELREMSEDDLKKLRSQIEHRLSVKDQHKRGSVVVDMSPSPSPPSLLPSPPPASKSPSTRPKPPPLSLPLAALGARRNEFGAPQELDREDSDLSSRSAVSLQSDASASGLWQQTKHWSQEMLRTLRRDTNVLREIESGHGIVEAKLRKEEELRRAAELDAAVARKQRADAEGRLKQVERSMVAGELEKSGHPVAGDLALGGTPRGKRHSLADLRKKLRHVSKPKRSVDDSQPLPPPAFKCRKVKIEGSLQPRMSHTVSVVGQEAFVIGGQDDKAFPVLPVTRLRFAGSGEEGGEEVQIEASDVPDGAAPLALIGHSATVVDNCVVVFGGGDGRSVNNKLFVFTPGQSPTWVAPTVQGKPPPPRVGHSATYLPKHRMVVVVGGFVPRKGYSNNVYILRVGQEQFAWERPRMTCRGASPPQGRMGHTAVPMKDGVLVFGGSCGKTAVHADFLRVDLEDKSASEVCFSEVEDVVGFTPQARTNHQSIQYTSRETIVFGGSCADHSYNDAYVLHHGSWTCQKLALEGTPLPPLSRHALFALGTSLFSFGGCVKGAPVGWLCELAEVPNPQRPQPRRSAS